MILLGRADRVQDVLGREVVTLRDDGVARRAARAVLFAAGIGQFRAGSVVDGSANAPARTQLTIRGVDHSINLQPSCATEHEPNKQIKCR